jgi:hypothetical protein
MAARNRSEYFEEGGREESFGRPSNAESVEEMRWAAIDSIPSHKLTNFALLRRTPSECGGEEGRTEMIDVRKLDRFNRELVVKKEALATNERDNSRLLSAIKERLDRYV